MRVRLSPFVCGQGTNSGSIQIADPDVAGIDKGKMRFADCRLAE